MLFGFLTPGRSPILQQSRLSLQVLTAANAFAQSTRAQTYAVVSYQQRGIRTDSPGQPRLLVVHPKQKSPALLQEALRLAESYAGTECPHIRAGPAKHHSITPSTYFGPGVVQTIQDSCTEYDPAKVFVNAALTPVQQRNLELAVGVPVLDRVGLIIDIFAQRARTREARLQVELAALEYRSSRLVRVLDSATGQRMGFGEGGATEVVSARERGRSGSSSGGLGGAGGGGQSELQLQRQRVITRRKALQRKLSEVQRTREVQRAGRRRSGKPVLAVVGYTNAGKSSLLQALTHTNAGVEDRLFATLDPALRRVHLPSGREAILSDTVGFISDLPHQLVNAFKATLEEVCEADLLLHVLDASSPDVQHQRSAVLQVLRDLGISETRLHSNLVEVWNKADLLPSDPPAADAADRQAQIGLSQQGDDNTLGLPSGATTSDTAPEHSASATGLPAPQQLQHTNLSSAPSLQQAAPGLPSVQHTASTGEAHLQQSTSSAAQVDAPQVGPQAGPQAGTQTDTEADTQAGPQTNQQNLLRLSQRAVNQTLQQHPEGTQSSPQQPQQQLHQQQQPHQHGPESDTPQSATEATLARPGLHAWLRHQAAESGGASGHSTEPVAVLTSAVTGAGLKELLLQVERKISVKCATRELADGTARLGPRLLTNTIVGPPNKHRRSRWRGLGEWESFLTQSLRD